MRQRGRKSANLLAINNVDGTPPRLTAPAGLNVKERAQFMALINSSSPNHFRENDIPLLVSLVQATLMARKLGRDPNRVSEWEKSVRVQAMLATKLRISPQSRTDPKTITRMQPGGGIAPWHVAQKLGRHQARHPTSEEYDADEED